MVRRMRTEAGGGGRGGGPPPLVPGGGEAEIGRRTDRVPVVQTEVSCLPLNPPPLLLLQSFQTVPHLPFSQLEQSREPPPRGRRFRKGVVTPEHQVPAPLLLHLLRDPRISAQGFFSRVISAKLLLV